MNIHRARDKRNVRGFSFLEILTVATMCTIVIGFIGVHFVQGKRSNKRVETAMEFANQIQKARLDSIRRNPTDVEQMAQIKIFNRKSYSLAIDVEGDTYLDIPLVMNLPEEGVSFDGPFPKTYIFNRFGQTVDTSSQRITPQAIILSNSSGKSAIKFSDNGGIVVVPTQPSKSK